MRPRIWLCSVTFFVATLGVAGSCAQAQSLYKSFLDRFDANKDGKISRGEVPEGDLRKAFDRMADKYQLDPKKVYTRAELEQILGITPSASSDSPATSGSGRGRSRGGRSDPPSSPTASAAGGGGTRSYRALVELPEDYRKYDKDGDGQVGLYEWPKNRIAEFLTLDKNGDGFLTVEELKKPSPREAKNKEEPKSPKPADAPAPAEDKPTDAAGASNPPDES